MPDRITQVEPPTVGRPGGAPVLSVIVPCFNERPNVAPMIAKLDAALAGIAWEVIYVDDNSPDGTTLEVRRIAQQDGRVRCIRRIGRRGLASAVIEGALSSSAAYVAVIDGDLQHDESRLPFMLSALQAGGYDLAVASRHVEGGDSAGLSSRWRHMLSDGGIWLAQAFLPVRLTDPMSGFFMLPRTLFEELARSLNGQGFKILLDLVLSSHAPLRVLEVPARFRERAAGESKMDALVMIQFGGLLLDKVFGGLLPLRFFSFALVGALGIVIHLSVLAVLRETSPLGFESEQAIATLVAMAFNFELNNVITYRDQRLRGPRLWRGLLLFMVVCGFGAVANVGIAQVLYERHTTWTVAGGIGAMIGVVWNYAVSATLVWRAR
ncbi:MAG: dolichol-phosphate mannosyltransferase [Acetobacteraceae bacterium]|jgi:dolichol-phosphate mannosyltransferase|nr:Undecaprenyl-phosphate mannosyltransferase [Rhodopila sp.]MEA2731633.1 dolichol-phosphate mannosyltransferase [Acetobacteraceae bacterium]